MDIFDAISMFWEAYGNFKKDDGLIRFETSWNEKKQSISKKNMSFTEYIDTANRTTVEDILTHHESSDVFDMINHVIELETSRYNHLMYNVKEMGQRPEKARL